ncbi:hypothetical protein HDU81_006473 [Chytriomyces hyalinus]|nr:hypothetical protein HDU81_006473 [Chytriomyces hyalinus]
MLARRGPKVLAAALFASLQRVSAVVIPRFLASTYPISEQLINTPAFLLNTTEITTSSACNLPDSLGLIATDYVVSINKNQLYTKTMEASVCGMCVEVYLGSNSDFNFTAVVADECEACDDGALAVSPTIYQKLLDLPTAPNTSLASPIQISWQEAPCPSTPDRIPTMSIAWSQPNAASFSPMQLYGLPSAVSSVYITWDVYGITTFTSAVWTQLILPATAFTSTPKALGTWSLPFGASTQKGPLGLYVVLRDNTILVTQSRTAYLGQNTGNAVVGLWVPRGDASRAVILGSAETGTGGKQQRKRDGGWSDVLLGLQRKDHVPAINLSGASIQNVTAGV